MPNLKNKKNKKKIAHCGGRVKMKLEREREKEEGEEEI